MKKFVFAAAASAVLLLAAGQVLAADYAQGSGGINNGVTPTTIQQGMPQGGAGMRTYMSAMPNGAGYQMMSTQPGSMMLAYGYSRQAAWWGLLIIITVALVWANLLLLIAFLWKQVGKHHHK
jgi:hypothetical protein